ncbi:glutamyl-tRNA reductase [Selenomonas ruminis]|uniref:Glutamyl-tRNA reductase n=1 Tax=Selenomonas ruminis TaxID=2593411 RepID=A0A5D6W6J8_9FIRM|nr:glutamyl-tRNA reductase [Selenomonas sp. mPRGC5]TYZ23883.1 glutamyl-tRNA reductase [Selenomonas sp. mPRGC5]
MELLMLGLNHKTAPVDVRERFAIPKQAIRDGLANLNEYEGLSEAVILSTCNRSEMYAVVDDLREDLPTLRQFLFDLTGNEEDIDEYLYHYENEECIRHLFKVASSLDSLVLGEGQILSQVKAAYALGREAGTTSTILNTLFHRAIACGKRVRTETRIQYNSVSISYAAVELARDVLGELTASNALIFGAGKMAELTAQHLVSHGIKKIYVTNRHLERAEQLAERFGGEAIPFDEAMKKAVDVDVIVTSTGAPHYVIKPWETRQLMTKRKGRQLFLIDIAVPRDVDPEVGEIKNVSLYNIDALEEVVDEHIQERREEAEQAKDIVEEEVLSIEDKFQYLSFRPLMALLSERCERIRQREIKRASSKLPDLTKEEQRQIEHMTRMIVRKILRMPMMKLNASAGTPQEEFYIDAMRSLFKLDTIGETATREERHHHYRYAEQ